MCTGAATSQAGRSHAASTMRFLHTAAVLLTLVHSSSGTPWTEEKVNALKGSAVGSVRRSSVVLPRSCGTSRKKKLPRAVFLLLILTDLLTVAAAPFTPSHFHFSHVEFVLYINVSL